MKHKKRLEARKKREEWAEKHTIWIKRSSGFLPIDAPFPDYDASDTATYYSESIIRELPTNNVNLKGMEWSERLSSE